MRHLSAAALFLAAASLSACENPSTWLDPVHWFGDGYEGRAQEEKMEKPREDEDASRKSLNQYPDLAALPAFSAAPKDLARQENIARDLNRLRLPEPR